MDHDPIYIENERLLIHSLKQQDLDSLRSMRCDELVYRYEPVFLTERQGSPEEALETLRRMDLYEDRQCVLGVYEKTDLNISSQKQKTGDLTRCVWQTCILWTAESAEL